MPSQRDARLRWPVHVVRLGLAHWLFGNLYEEVVHMPERLGPSDRLLGTGSPVRYYLPAAPITLAATVITAVEPGGADRGWRLAVVGLTAAGGTLTGYVVRTVIVPLMGNEALDDVTRARLARRWHRVNRVRIGLAAAALLTSTIAGHSTVRRT